MKIFLTSLILSSVTTIASAGVFAPWHDRGTENSGDAAVSAGSTEPLVTSTFAPWPTQVAASGQADSNQKSATNGGGSAFQPWLRRN